MSFFKRIFKKEEKQRSLSDVRELKIKDIIVLTDSFGLPEALRNQQFQVSAINCYEFERKTQTEWVLIGSDDIELYLTLDEDDKTYLKFSLKVNNSEIESLFDLDEFSTIFDEPGNAFLDIKADKKADKKAANNRFACFIDSDEEEDEESESDDEEVAHTTPRIYYYYYYYYYIP